MYFVVICLSVSGLFTDESVSSSRFSFSRSISLPFLFHLAPEGSHVYMAGIHTSIQELSKMRSTSSRMSWAFDDRKNKRLLSAWFSSAMGSSYQ